MQKPQNISVLKFDPDLEPPTILFDSISIEFLSPLSRKLLGGRNTIPIREYLSTEFSPSPNCATYPRGIPREFRSLGGRDRACRSGLFIDDSSRCLVHGHLRHRIVVSLLSPPPPPRGRDTAAYFHRYAIPSESSS